MTIIGKPVYSDELLHYQVKGAHWGVRRWQNLDGSLTPEGRIHYGIGPARDKDPDLDHPIEKAMTEAFKDDPFTLDNLWRTNQYYGESGKALDEWEKKNGTDWWMNRKKS